MRKLFTPELFLKNKKPAQSNLRIKKALKSENSWIWPFYNFEERLRNNGLTIAGSGGSFDADKDGIHYSQTTSQGGEYLQTANNITVSTGYTLFIVLKGDSNSVTSETTQPLSIESDSFGLSWSHTVAGFDQAFYIQTDGYYPAKFTTTIVADTLYVMACSWDGSNLRVFLNGTKEATAAASSTLVATTQLNLGSGQTGASSWDGNIYFCALTDYAMAEDIITEISRDLYNSFFEPNVVEFYKTSAAAPGTTVIKLAGDGGLAGPGGLAGRHGGLAG